LVTGTSQYELVAAVAEADAASDDVLILAGGSNVVVSDTGFPGTVVLVRNRGSSIVRDGTGAVRMTVQAGEPWDVVVARAVAEGLSGIECLSGIPGSTGATPIQNVGAYGQEVAETITGLRAYDRARRCVVELSPADCRFSYRNSALKQTDRHVVLDVTFTLTPHEFGRALRYPELAAALDEPVGGRAPLADVRAAVLELRRRKGMVIDPADPDTASVGSFFTNPVLAAGEFEALAARTKVTPPHWPMPDGRVKTSAAWLIERAGFPRGYGTDRVRISTKHTLALANLGGGTAADLLGLAREIRRGVRDAFGVELVNEPVLVGNAL
jgi:UDP-N-acetylmuramate dehydrogenase